MGLAAEVAPLEAAKVGLAGLGAGGLEQLERAARIAGIPGGLGQVELGGVERAAERVLGGREGPVRGLGRRGGAARLDRLGVGALRLGPGTPTRPGRPRPAAPSGPSGRAAPTALPYHSPPITASDSRPTAHRERRQRRVAAAPAGQPLGIARPPRLDRLVVEEPLQVVGQLARPSRSGATARARSPCGRSSPGRGGPRGSACCSGAGASAVTCLTSRPRSFSSNAGRKASSS